MVRPIANKLVFAALAGAFLTGCGATQYPYGTAVDAYGNPIAGTGYGTDTSGYSTGSTYGSSTSYATDTSSSYGSTSSYPTSYGSTSSYPTSYGSTSGYPTTTVPVVAPTPAPAVFSGTSSDPAVLSAYVKDCNTTGLLGLGGVIAHVEVTNPTSRTMSGKLHVTFTDGGHPTGNMQTRKITLRPLETQLLTFTAKAWHLNDAEATIDTDVVVPTQSTVVDVKGK